MAKTEHTPGPWRNTEGGIIDSTPSRGHAGIEIADVYGADVHDNRGPSDTIEAKANADLIVKAVNCHAVLLTALKGLVNCHTGAPWQTAEVKRRWFLQAADAIAKAEKEVRGMNDPIITINNTIVSYLGRGPRPDTAYYRARDVNDNRFFCVCRGLLSVVNITEVPLSLLGSQQEVSP